MENFFQTVSVNRCSISVLVWLWVFIFFWVTTAFQGEFAEADPWVRTQSLCWLEWILGRTLCFSLCPHVAHTEWGNQRDPSQPWCGLYQHLYQPPIPSPSLLSCLRPQVCLPFACSGAGSHNSLHSSLTLQCFMWRKSWSQEGLWSLWLYQCLPCWIPLAAWWQDTLCVVGVCLLDRGSHITCVGPSKP